MEDWMVKWFVAGITIDLIIITANILAMILIRRHPPAGGIKHVLLSLSVCDFLFGVLFLIADLMHLYEDKTSFTATHWQKLNSFFIAGIVFFLLTELLHAFLIAAERVLTTLKLFNCIGNDKQRVRCLVSIWSLSIIISTALYFHPKSSQSIQVALFLLISLFALIIFVTLTVLLVRFGNRLSTLSGSSRHIPQTVLIFIMLVVAGVILCSVIYFILYYIICLLPPTLAVSNMSDHFVLDESHIIVPYLLQTNSLVNPLIVLGWQLVEWKNGRWEQHDGWDNRNDDSNANEPLDHIAVIQPRNSHAI